MAARSNPCEIYGDADISQGIADQYATRMRKLGNDLLYGTLSLEEFQERMQDSIRLSFIQQAIEGAFEQDERTLTTADMRRIETDIAEQFEYLDNFMDDIETAVKRDGGSLSFIPARAALYAQSSKKSYWKQAAGIELEHVPGDGSSQCLGNCTCKLRVECELDSKGRRTAVLVFWELDPASEEVHCVTCPERARLWNPLRVPLLRGKAA